MKKVFVSIILLSMLLPVAGQKFTSPFEKTSGNQTATYFETIAFYQALSKQFNNIILKTFLTTDAGLPLHLVVISSDSKFDAKKWHKQGKIVLLINNGIHAGEPDGIDASMMLIRDLAMKKIALPANVAVAVIPVYNIGGALNRNSFSRVNQEGPESYGFRGNSQNLDLNRDFTKADSKNALAFAKIFHYLDPDIFMDNHVSDGADYQHVMTLLTTQHNKLGGGLGTYLHNTFEPELYKAMEQNYFPMTPYVNFEEGNPEKGWTAFYDAPRYSCGYTALFQTIGFTPETHMLKPFKQRVAATYTLMEQMILVASKQAAALKMAKQQMIAEVRQQKEFALGWKLDTSTHETITFKGYEAGYKKSNITGLPRLYYDRSRPFTKQVNYYNTFKPEKMVALPKFYIIPQGWWSIIERLQTNNVMMTRLKNDTNINVEVYRIEQYKSSATPYEKHHKNSEVVVSKSIKTLLFLKGDYIIECNQRANRYLAEMLEPTGDDSFFAWNFFDAILQQKEGYSDYRWEDIAEKYIADHPILKQQLNEKKKADAAFAASASAQLNFIYKNSPYYEPAHMRYPVYRWNP